MRHQVRLPASTSILSIHRSFGKNKTGPENRPVSELDMWRHDLAKRGWVLNGIQVAFSTRVLPLTFVQFIYRSLDKNQTGSESSRKSGISYRRTRWFIPTCPDRFPFFSFTSTSRVSAAFKRDQARNRPALAQCNNDGH